MHLLKRSNLLGTNAQQCYLTADNLNQNNTSLRESETTEAIHTLESNIDCHTPLRSVRNDVKRAAFTLAEAADARQTIRHPELVSGSLSSITKAAFTLAEVLTTLVIIGIIAAITVPVLQSTISDHILEKQQKVFERKFDQNLHVMQLKGELSKQYSSTMDFVKVMQKYMNITKVCDSNHLNECFAEKIMQNKRQVKFTTSKTTPLSGSAKYLANSEAADIRFSNLSELVGIVFADGVNAIIAHDHDCIVTDKYNQTADVSYCLALFYDANGEEGPNMIDQDILTMNVGTKAINIGDVFNPISGRYTIDQCEDARTNGAPITYCETSNDSFSKAANTCFEEGYRLPTRQELKEIAQQVYGTPIALTATTSGLSISNQELAQKLGISSEGSPFYFLSAEEADGTNVYARYFSGEKTQVASVSKAESSHGGGTAIRAFCIIDDNE